jgi:hypothetical protein
VNKLMSDMMLPTDLHPAMHCAVPQIVLRKSSPIFRRVSERDSECQQLGNDTPTPAENVMSTEALGSVVKLPVLISGNCLSVPGLQPKAD